jgi:hypothetical protein
VRRVVFPHPRPQVYIVHRRGSRPRRALLAPIRVIAVHACWSPFGLHLWGESATRLSSLAPPRGRTPRAARPHPFAADARELREALRPLTPVNRAAAGEITLRLPSRGRVPLASPHLAHVAPEGAGGDGQATAWTAGALSLSGPDALDVLLALPAAAADGAEMEGVALGDSVRAFGELAKLALEMVAGGRVLPLLERAHGGRWTARGRPVVTTQADGERLALLRRTMPGACAAHAPAAAADDVAGRALDALVDACARGGLEEAGFPPRRAAQRTPAEAWRDALFAPQAAPQQGGAAWERIHAALGTWSRPLAPATAGGLRTCFQLTAPVDPAAGVDAAVERMGMRGAWTFCCRRRTTPACWCPPRTSGARGGR